MLVSTVRTSAAVNTGEKSTVMALQMLAAASPRWRLRNAGLLSSGHDLLSAAVPSAALVARISGTMVHACVTPMVLCTMRCGLYVASEAIAQLVQAAEVKLPINR